MVDSIMIQPRICPDCGVQLASDAPDGACPACALRGALSPESGGSIAANPPPTSTSSPGTKVHYFGDYEIGAEIGRGGMGVVYKARQVSLNRDVALKMILAGRLASETEVKRFVHEARAAANLQHPNIVAVHEVGVHDGHHYYSMDFIEGRNLEQLVRQQLLPPLQAAEYMSAIADAIHFAHKNGTLHRDLKPTNILIDIFNQPRVTDFGLARCEALDPHLTASGQVLGTPGFMSPEQAQAKSAVLGPHSDVYSAGAVLYYLLTQRAPFAAGSVAETLDLVIHHEPVSPRALNPSVPRDLETICLKCLDKDPARRYRSAQDLSDELGRFSRGEPILARPPNVAERAWRWCARNRALSASLGTAALLLVSGVVVSTWQAVRAKAEAAKSRQIANFLQDMLKGVGPSVALGRDTKMLREILDQTAERIGKELKGQPVVEAELRATIGDVYVQLGEYGKAEAMHREALRLARHVYGPEHPEVASALDNVSIVLYRQGKFVDAEALERQVLAMRIKALGRDHPQVAMSLINLAAFLQAEGKLADAEAVSREALAANRKLYGSGHELVTTGLNNLGCLLCQEDKLPEAEAIFREVLAAKRKSLGNDHPDVATLLNNLGKILADQGKMAEAETTFREALALRRKLLGGEHPDVAQTLDSLAGIVQDRGRLAEAETMYRESLAMRKKTLGAEHPFVALSLNNLADLLDDEGEAADAEAMQRDALAMQRKLLGSEHPDVARSLYNLARLIRSRRRSVEAETMSREALAMRRKLLGNDHPDVADSLAQLAGVLRDRGRLDDAEPLLRECLSIREKGLPDDWLTFSARSALGENLLARKKYAEAEPLLLSGYNGLNEREAKIPAASRRRLKEAGERLIRLYQETSRPDKAAEWKRKVDESSEPQRKGR
ncbi:MAG TPA: serine/threonine-protein kinase [Dongiaceae bacterium]|nr:serine/threonine-protein kinase [Dongiaceae bacterium]